jgi:hypothetical protein
VATPEAEPPSDPNYGYFYTVAFDDEQGLYVASGYGGVTRHDLGDGTSQSLLRAEPFTLALDLTAEYVDEASYTDLHSWLSNGKLVHATNRKTRRAFQQLRVAAALSEVQSPCRPYSLARTMAGINGQVRQRSGTFGR